jgi:hypothetical protein
MAWTGPDMPDGIPRLLSQQQRAPVLQQVLNERITVVEEILCSLQRYLQPKEPANFAHRLDMVEAHIVALRALLRLPPPDAPDSDGYQRAGFDSWQAVARTVANLSVKCSQLETERNSQGEKIGYLHDRLEALERRSLSNSAFRIVTDTDKKLEVSSQAQQVAAAMGYENQEMQGKLIIPNVYSGNSSCGRHPDPKNRQDVNVLKVCTCGLKVDIGN